MKTRRRIAARTSRGREMPLHVHEVHKVVNDLTRREQYAVAFAICALYRHVFDDGYLHHRYMTLPWRMGDLNRTVALLREELAQDRWISHWYMRQFGAFADFMQEPALQAVLADIRTAEKTYRESELARPITTAPDDAKAPFPLLVALHGNGLNATHSAENWAVATDLVV